MLDARTLYLICGDLADRGHVFSSYRCKFTMSAPNVARQLVVFDFDWWGIPLVSDSK